VWDGVALCRKLLALYKSLMKAANFASLFIRLLIKNESCKVFYGLCRVM
jgi:hypothetical protein